LSTGSGGPCEHGVSDVESCRAVGQWETVERCIVIETSDTWATSFRSTAWWLTIAAHIINNSD